MTLNIGSQPLIKKGKEFFMNNQRISFLSGLVAAPLLFALVFFAFQFALQVVAPQPHTAELEYASYSLRTGDGGGSVIPASCDSGVEHWAGDLEPCAVPVNPWNLRAQCVNHTATFWWETPAYTDYFALRVHDNAYGWSGCGGTGNWCWDDVGVGSGFSIPGLYGPTYTWWIHACNRGVGCSSGIGGPAINCAVKPAPVITGRTCHIDSVGPVVHITWAGVAGASRYLPRLAGADGPWCQSIGWNWDGTTCYYDWVGGNDAWFRMVPGQAANFWIHAGDPVGPANGTGNFTCGSQPKGWIGGATCGSTPDSGNIWGWACDADSWGSAVPIHIYRDGPAGVGVFVGSTVANLEGPSLAPHCGGTTAHVFSYTIPETLRDNGYHNYYAYAIDVGPGGVPGSSGNPLLQGNPLGTTCTMAAPTNVNVTCNAAGTQATMSWTGVPGYTTYYTRVSSGGFGVGPMVSGGTNDNFVGTSLPFAVNPNQTYYYWVHTKHPTTGSWSAHAPLPSGGTFSCPAPASPASSVAISAINQATGISSATNLSIVPSQEVSIQWVSANATNCTASAGTGFSTGGALSGTDTDVVEPGATLSTTYTVNCTGAGAPSSASVTVSATAAAVPPTITLDAANTIVRQGQSANLNWSISAGYDLTCNITGGGMNQTVPYTLPSDSDTVTTPPLNSTQIFTLTCTSPLLAAPVSDTARVDVVPDQQEI